MRYDASLYEKPDMDHQVVREDGRTYYEVADDRIGMRTDVLSDGSVVVERNYGKAVRRRSE